MFLPSAGMSRVIGTGTLEIESGVKSLNVFILTMETIMKKYLIFGTNGIAKDLCNFIEDAGDEMLAYVQDRKYIKEGFFYGKKILPYEELGNCYSKDEITLLIVVGYSRMSENRKIILERCRKDGWDISSFIHTSVLNYAKFIGDGNLIFPNVYLGSDAVIGNGNIIGARSALGHDSVLGNYNFFAGDNRVCGQVSIGNHNFLGDSCTVVDNLKMGDYNLVGAGVCLNKNMQSHTIAANTEIRMQPMNLKGMDLLLKRTLK